MQRPVHVVWRACWWTSLFSYQSAMVGNVNPRHPQVLSDRPALWTIGPFPLSSADTFGDFKTTRRRAEAKRAENSQVLELLECAVLLAWSDSGGYIALPVILCRLGWTLCEWSGRRDSNPRSPGPEPGAIPGFATSRNDTSTFRALCSILAITRSRTESQFAKLGHNYEDFTHSITPA